MNHQHLSVLLTITYAADMLLNLFTLAIGPMTARVSARRYLKRHFLLDLMTTIPFDLILNTLPSAECFLLLRLLRLYRMYWIVTTNPLYAAFGNNFHTALGVPKGFLGVLPLGAVLVAYMHFYSCLLWLVARLTGYAFAVQSGKEQLLAKSVGGNI